MLLSFYSVHAVSMTMVIHINYCLQNFDALRVQLVRHMFVPQSSNSVSHTALSYLFCLSLTQSLRSSIMTSLLFSQEHLLVSSFVSRLPGEKLHLFHYLPALASVCAEFIFKLFDIRHMCNLVRFENPAFYLLILEDKKEISITFLSRTYTTVTLG